MARAATDDPDPDPDDASALPGITREEARAMALDALGATGAEDDERTAEALSAARMGAVALSDETRGAAYRLAVETHARDADLVLDVGGGVGLLGVVAARAGAKRVVTFAPSTANLASSVALANDVPPDRLHVLDARVADARPDGLDAWRVRADAPVLGAVLDVAHPRANLVLAESLETKLLDPGPLADLRRAAATLLSPGYACVPAAAVVRAQVVTSAHLRDSITLRPLGDAADPADPIWSRETLRTSIADGGEVDLVAVSEPFEAFRVDFANLPPPGTLETRANVPIILGDERKSGETVPIGAGEKTDDGAVVEAVAVAYWWTCDATKSAKSAKSANASSPPARGSPTRRLAILPAPVRIPGNAITLAVSIARDDDGVRFRVAARAEDLDDPSSAAAAFPPPSSSPNANRLAPPANDDPVPNTSVPNRSSTSIPWDSATVARWNSSTFRESWRVAVREALYDFRSHLFTSACVDASDGPALAILAADAGAKGVLSLETTREGAVFARRLARACGVDAVVQACAVRFDEEEHPKAGDFPPEDFPRGSLPFEEHRPRHPPSSSAAPLPPSSSSSDCFAVAGAASTEATRACLAAKAAAAKYRAGEDDVVAALEAYEYAVAEALRERRVPTPCGPENAYGLDDPWNDPWNEHESGDRGQVDEDALGFLFGSERFDRRFYAYGSDADAWFDGVDHESARDDPRVKALWSEYERRAAVAEKRRRRADALRADAERAEAIAVAALGATRATLPGARVASLGTVTAPAWTFFADPWFAAEATKGTEPEPGTVWAEAGLREMLRRRRWARRAGVLHIGARSSPRAAAIRVAPVACPKLAEDAERRRRLRVVLGVDLAALDRSAEGKGGAEGGANVVAEEGAAEVVAKGASVIASVVASGDGASGFSASPPISVFLSDVSHTVLAAPLAALLVPLQGYPSELRAATTNVVRARFHGGASGATCDAFAAWVDYDLGGGAWITTGPDPAGAASNYGVAGSPNPDDGGTGGAGVDAPAKKNVVVVGGKRRRRANHSSEEVSAEAAAAAAAAAANSSVETRRTASTTPTSPSSPSSRRRSYDFASATVTPGPFRQGIFFLDAPVTAPPGGWATIEAETRFHPDEGFTAKILSTRVERG